VPELPEVETVRRGLAALVIGKTIAAVDVRLARIVRTPDVQLFQALLTGARVTDVRRRGKYLLIDTEDHTLVSHLRMEGRYGLYPAAEPVEAHTHVLFTFVDGTELRYRDVRQFGTMDLLTPQQLAQWPNLRALGPEPFDEVFNAVYLGKILSRRQTPIKSALLDQTIVAGLGNIYVDEILHRSGVHPERIAASLSKMKLAAIVEHARAIMEESIELGGSSIKSYVNGFGAPGGFQFSLRVYGRTGQPCQTCGQPIVKGRVTGRGTHVCVRCQKPPRGASMGSAAATVGRDCQNARKKASPARGDLKNGEQAGERE